MSHTITIGEELPSYVSVAATSNNNAYGTVSSTSSQNVGYEASVTLSGTNNTTLTVGSKGSYGSYSVTATPTSADEDYGYVFSGWTDGNGNAVTTGYKVTANTTFTANFVRYANGTITAVASPNVTTDFTISPSTRQAGGSNVSITAPAEVTSGGNNYVFTGWADNSSTTNPRTVIVDGDRTYTANYARKYTITAVSENVAKGTVTGGGAYGEGTNTNLQATAADGYEFSYWSDGTSNYTTNPLVRPVTGDATYTAYFEELTSSMSIVSCSSGADIEAHFDYSNVTITYYNENSYFVDATCDNYMYVSQVSASNSNNDKLNLYFTLPYRNESYYYKNYSGGECTKTLSKAPDVGTYELSPSSHWSNGTWWCIPGNQKAITYAAVQDYYDNVYENKHCDITMQNNSQKHWDLDAQGSLIVSQNNAGGLFIETSDNVREDSKYQSVYFTLGNRSENTVNLGTGTMTASGSNLTFNAFKVENSQNYAAKIKIKQNTTGSVTQTNFDLNQSSFLYQDSYIEEIKSITGTLSKSGNTYTLSLKIRDCSENLYIVTMSAPAPVYNITYKNKGNAAFTGTQTNAPTTHTFGTATTLRIPTRTGYTFGGWYRASDCASQAVGNASAASLGATAVTADITLYAKWTVNTYNITFKNEDGTTLKKSDGTTDAVYSVAYGETPAYDGATPTKAADSEYTYTFNGWDNEIVAVTTAATYTATYSTTKVQYTLTWDVNGGNALTGTYTNGTIDWGTDIVKPANPTRTDYTFGGWDANNDGKADEVAKTMPTTSLTYKAIWIAELPNITLCENCDNDHYNTFKSDYDKKTVNVTYPRQFSANRWSTMCLPFSLDLATMIANKMYGRVYEFKYATGNANTNSGVNLYFSNAKKIEAGTCYIVNANDALAAKTSFVFRGVTIDLSKDNGVALTSVGAYNNLPGYLSEGTIELVGTLRNGTLKGSATGNKYMGLKNNKIYYPNTDTGSTIWAYRGIFRSSEILDKQSMQKMRIIVDGEDRGELIIDADGDILAPSDAQSRKFIRDGVLYIEREGVVYDAQGKRVED